MAKTKLTAMKITKEIAKGYLGRMPDDNGLNLLVRASGTHSWQYRYQSPLTKKERIKTIGNYPKLSLAQARAEHIVLMADVQKGICVQEEYLKIKNTKPIIKDSFESVAMEWLEIQKPNVAEVTWDKDWSRLQRFVFPKFAEKFLDEITAKDLLAQCTKVSETNGKETAHRTMNVVKRVLKYGLVTNRVKYNVAEGLTEYLPTPEKEHRKGFTDEKDLGKLMYAIENDSDKRDIVGCALRLMPHIFVRHQEMLDMKWEELDFKKKVWDREVTKTKKTGVAQHKVFLSEQVITILKELKDLTGHTDNVFNSYGKTKVIRQKTVTNRKEALGFDVDIHGFRASARTLGYEKLKVNRDVVEKCLAHVTKETLGESYDRTTLVPERKQFMQDWSDYLFELIKQQKKKTIRAVK